MKKINPRLLIVGVIIIIVSGIIITTLLINNSPQNQQANLSQTVQNLPTLPPLTNITLSENGFEPNSVTVKKGDLVIWKNESGKDATVNSDTHPEHNEHPELNLGQFPDGYSLQTRMEKAGTYKYHNHLNHDQTGTIIVE